MHWHWKYTRFLQFYIVFFCLVVDVLVPFDSAFDSVANTAWHQLMHFLLHAAILTTTSKYVYTTYVIRKFIFLFLLRAASWQCHTICLRAFIYIYMFMAIYFILISYLNLNWKFNLFGSIFHCDSSHLIAFTQHCEPSAVNLYYICESVPIRM